ncbi:MAG TPA: biopolymer transporter ExbD [Acidobacteriota bacterium]|jgi:biopolymer transport protein ExbD|nr:biopolymer transporter ExbD [Acidobacteriota bacterium]HRR26510.1 biopolymer transporter ExbD [Acidobacteriota bacterium]HRR56202.1 biopolymer transporter ExbD [Acidobacteriota bacterium]HRV07771.1 biopolymer transporter ExbD [Acidobacteriota bacterium]
MAKRRSRLQRAAEVPTSSMADIAFLLIVFFMLTAVYTTNQGLRFQFPKDDPTDLNIQPEEAIHIKVLGEGTYQVDRVPMTRDEMAGYINAKVQENPSKPVIIQTLPEVPYAAMVDVFDLLKQLEVKNVSVPTESEIARWRALGYFQ